MPSALADSLTPVPSPFRIAGFWTSVVESFSLPFRFELHNALKRKVRPPRSRLALSHRFPFLKLVGMLVYCAGVLISIMSLGPKIDCNRCFRSWKDLWQLVQFGDAKVVSVNVEHFLLAREVDMRLSLV